MQAWYLNDVSWYGVNYGDSSLRRVSDEDPNTERRHTHHRYFDGVVGLSGQ